MLTEAEGGFELEPELELEVLAFVERGAGPELLFLWLGVSDVIDDFRE